MALRSESAHAARGANGYGVAGKPHVYGKHAALDAGHWFASSSHDRARTRLP